MSKRLTFEEMGEKTENAIKIIIEAAQINSIEPHVMLSAAGQFMCGLAVTRKISPAEFNKGLEILKIAYQKCYQDDRTFEEDI